MMRIFVILMALALLLSGCGALQDFIEGGSDAVLQQDNNTIREEEEPEPEAVNNQEVVSSELEGLFDKKRDLAYKITWDVTDKGPGKVKTYDIVQYVNGSDMRTDREDQSVETRTYIIDGERTMCYRFGYWNCREEGEKSAYVQVEDDFAWGRTSRYEVERLDSKTIDGAEASCYLVSSSGVEVEYCFSDNGVPLYIMTRVPGQGVSSEMVAQKHSMGIPSDALELPASN